MSTRDSYSPLLYVVQVSNLVHQGSLLSGDGAVTLQRDYVQGFTITESTEAAVTAQFTIFDRSGGMLEQGLFSPARGTRLIVRFDWDNTSNGPPPTDYPSPMPITGNASLVGPKNLFNLVDVKPYRFKVTAVTPKYQSDGIVLTIDAVGEKLLEMNTALPASMTTVASPGEPPPSIFNFRARQSPSEIAQQIATFFNFPESKQVIQPSANVFAHPVSLPAGWTVEKFLRWLASRSYHNVSVGNVGVGVEPTLYYIDERESTFHFHGATYFDALSPNRPQAKLAAKYVFFRDGRGEVIDFTPNDDSLKWIANTGGSGKHDAPSSKHGESVTITTYMGRGMEDQGAPPTMRTGRYYLKVNQFSTDNETGLRATSRHMPVFLNNIDEARQSVERFQAKATQTAMTATLRVRGTHRVKPLNDVFVEYNAAVGTFHYLSGFYKVYKITHTVEGGVWHTEFELARSGIRAPDEAGTTDEPAAVNSTSGHPQIDDSGGFKAAVYSPSTVTEPYGV